MVKKTVHSKRRAHWYHVRQTNLTQQHFGFTILSSSHKTSALWYPSTLRIQIIIVVPFRTDILPASALQSSTWPFSYSTGLWSPLFWSFSDAVFCAVCVLSIPKDLVACKFQHWRHIFTCLLAYVALHALMCSGTYRNTVFKASLGLEITSSTMKTVFDALITNKHIKNVETDWNRLHPGS